MFEFGWVIYLLGNLIAGDFDLKSFGLTQSIERIASPKIYFKLNHCLI
jgi:hypothetical protein